MSYVPKYILKRMVPQDALKKVEGGGTMTLINVIQPLPADQIPGDPLDFLQVKINDKELSREEMSKIEVTFEEKKFNMGNISEAGTIPVGAQLVFFLPSDEFKVGEELTVEVIIPEVNINIAITRTVQ